MSAELEQLLATQCEMIAELQANANWRAEGRYAIEEADLKADFDSPLSEIIGELCEMTAELQADADWRAEGRYAIEEADLKADFDSPLSEIIGELCEMIPDENLIEELADANGRLATATFLLEMYLSETCGSFRPAKIHNPELQALADFLFYGTR